jgi:hypothetical protein
MLDVVAELRVEALEPRGPSPRASRERVVHLGERIQKWFVAMYDMITAFATSVGTT